MGKGCTGSGTVSSRTLILTAIPVVPFSTEESVGGSADNERVELSPETVCYSFCVFLHLAIM